MSVGFYKTGIVKGSGIVTADNLLRYVPKSVTANQYQAYQLQFDEKLKANQPYTMQLWDVDVSHSEKTAEQLGIYIYMGGGSVGLYNWHGTQYFTNGHSDYLVGTFTPTQANIEHAHASNLWFNIYNSVSYVAGTMNMSIGRWKLEEGIIATPWSFNPNDQGYIQSNPGFIEYGNMMKVYKDGIVANDFMEY